MSDVAEPVQAPKSKSRLRTRGGVTEVAPDKPHWIVLCMSNKGVLDTHHGLRFRHPSEQTAKDEATRLAWENAGRRYSVFACVGSYKFNPTVK